VQDCLSAEKSKDGSLQKNLRALLYAAYTVRDIWSQDSWRILTEIEETGDACSLPNTPPTSLEKDFGDLIGKLNAFYGLNANGMTRESGWNMLMLGRVIESGVGLCELIQGSLEQSDGSPVSYGMMEMALEQNENLITYRRHYRTTPQLHSVLELMTASEINPRSLVFYLEQANFHLDKLPPPMQTDMLQPVIQRVKQVRAELIQGEALNLFFDGTIKFLPSVRDVLEQVSSVVSSAYFSHTTLRQRENF
jgi:uncharacterized alpha-E superfamily protein